MAENNVCSPFAFPYLKKVERSRFSRPVGHARRSTHGQQESEREQQKVGDWRHTTTTAARSNEKTRGIESCSVATNVLRSTTWRYFLLVVVESSVYTPRLHQILSTANRCVTRAPHILLDRNSLAEVLVVANMTHDGSWDVSWLTTTSIPSCCDLRAKARLLSLSSK